MGKYIVEMDDQLASLLKASGQIRVIVKEEVDEPYISAHLSGNVLWIDMMYVPPQMRRRGFGAKYYKDWEKSIPSTVRLIRLMAADTGSGLSNGFWERMDFEYQYDGENLDYETSQYMWKGVNGNPTPDTIYIDDEGNY